MSATTVSDAQPPKAPKKKLPLILVACVVLAGAGGGGWYFWQQREANASAQQGKAEPKRAPKKQLYIALEPFTVNLQDPMGDRFAQIGVTLQVEDPSVETDLKERLPSVRNQILILISSKRIGDLLTPEGKQTLAREIRQHTGHALGLPGAGHAPAPAPPPTFAAAPAAQAKPPEPENPIKDVLFSQFIVQ